MTRIPDDVCDRLSKLLAPEIRAWHEQQARESATNRPTKKKRETNR